MANSDYGTDMGARVTDNGNEFLHYDELYMSKGDEYDNRGMIITPIDSVSATFKFLNTDRLQNDLKQSSVDVQKRIERYKSNIYAMQTDFVRRFDVNAASSTIRNNLNKAVQLTKQVLSALDLWLITYNDELVNVFQAINVYDGIRNNLTVLKFKIEDGTDVSTMDALKFYKLKASYARTLARERMKLMNAENDIRKHLFRVISYINAFNLGVIPSGKNSDKSSVNINSINNANKMIYGETIPWEALQVAIAQRKDGGPVRWTLDPKRVPNVLAELEPIVAKYTGGGNAAAAANNNDIAAAVNPTNHPDKRKYDFTRVGGGESDPSVATAKKRKRSYVDDNNTSRRRIPAAAAAAAADTIDSGRRQAVVDNDMLITDKDAVNAMPAADAVYSNNSTHTVDYTTKVVDDRFESPMEIDERQRSQDNLLDRERLLRAYEAKLNETGNDFECTKKKSIATTETDKNTTIVPNSQSDLLRSTGELKNKSIRVSTTEKNLRQKFKEFVRRFKEYGTVRRRDGTASVARRDIDVLKSTTIVGLNSEIDDGKKVIDEVCSEKRSTVEKYGQPSPPPPEVKNINQPYGVERVKLFAQLDECQKIVDDLTREIRKTDEDGWVGKKIDTGPRGRRDSVSELFDELLSRAENSKERGYSRQLIIDTKNKLDVLMSNNEALIETLKKYKNVIGFDEIVEIDESAETDEHQNNNSGGSEFEYVTHPEVRKRLVGVTEENIFSDLVDDNCVTGADNNIIDDDDERDKQFPAKEAAAAAAATTEQIVETRTDSWCSTTNAEGDSNENNKTDYAKRTDTKKEVIIVEPMARFTSVRYTDIGDLTAFVNTVFDLKKKYEKVSVRYTVPFATRGRSEFGFNYMEILSPQLLFEHAGDDSLKSMKIASILSEYWIYNDTTCEFINMTLLKIATTLLDISAIIPFMRTIVDNSEDNVYDRTVSMLRSIDRFMDGGTALPFIADNIPIVESGTYTRFLRLIKTFNTVVENFDLDQLTPDDYLSLKIFETDV
ncbi:hypothetical protein AGLY_017560 [Aphis glycines]|uniref:Uncharacterized protein n=1 Tax=Aphis glycines TaxID=307491 RepID=A0A6G0SUH2_APHGL|nr:hypothetical protein AGLY_017560 [Aphis glycines]